ncbi:Uncharacterised protein [Mycobacteroides abscessus subsp. abscessus]|nr:Uncharacterised protein [Mycobacteroides abscessus subsp. abscessus]
MQWITPTPGQTLPALRPLPYHLGGPLIPHTPPQGEDVNPACGHYWPDLCDGCGVCTTCDGCRCRAAERD